MFKMDRMTNAEFMTNNMKQTNPLFNMVMLDGMIVPISMLPEKYQKMAREAKMRGEDVQFWTKK